ncbi:inter-alpha-trypsin inhibitor heavy chain H5 isoform X2 [Megalops cyprinoides]|uniref:inter-alpha-trypsin inhibitor heavy chain H5 isoform X2 n=1 Tax=Megalops cyprinoides TaxID=118141 RepID=UPI001864E7AE|nr:inter-alpha-trypsin inhibitor heavy chain H5 isoform X2 [Megalops cyprinoides]
MDVKTIFVALLLCFFTGTQCEDVDPKDDNFSELGLEIAPRRLPRQIKAMLLKETKPHIQDLTVKTTIISRYAFTAVSCTMVNRHSAATKGVFQFQLPASAFVSNFTMIIGGRVYPSEVKPKEKKVKQVKEGDNKPKTDEQGGQSESEMETFRVSASVPGKNRAVFLLTYEELLQRRLGKYEHVTSLRPLQLVSRLLVDVTIVDRSEITDLEVLPLRNGKNGNGAKAQGNPSLPVSTVIKQNKTYCKITFSPNIIQQARITTNGVLGDFIVRYDVEREMGIGDIQVLNGHFVHYFAPKDLPVVPKNVVFVIDTSASMVGTKMRQTKEALFTILKDLRPNDRFNFVSFSNRIKVWQPGQLVAVTPNNIRDAKKFIYMISPTGGTDINGAIQTGSSLLSNYLSSTGGHHNSVSLIIFLTDGRPTVGEVRSPSILSNTRSAVQEKFCVFTIGIGNDVDYRLLERMALENCGMMRRIHEESDASAMLKGFYDEIGTPLLSDVRVGYTEDLVQYVTQNLFTNYFNGSEIIIAGKLTNQSAESLHVQVTASSSDKSIVLETDVALRERELETRRQVEAAEAGPAAEAYVERAWGFLTVKEGLRDRVRSPGGQEREELTQRVANLSQAYGFLTPVTSLVLETPDAELQDADAVNDSASAAAATNGTDPVEEPTAGTAEEKPQSLHRSPEQPVPSADKTVRKPVKKSITISKTSADGDPHFIVEFPLSKLTVCFNINGEPGQVLRLVSDHKHSGVTVNGKLIGAPAPAHSRKQQRTYFSTIAVVIERPRRAYIEITARKVILDGKDRLVLPCDKTAAVESDGLGVAIAGGSNITVMVQGTISFVILIHQYKNPAPFQKDHLGFYISNSKGLSKESHGLLGQFLYQEVGLMELPTNATTANTTATMIQTNATAAKLSTNATMTKTPTNTTTAKVHTNATVTKIAKNTMATKVSTNATVTKIPKNTTAIKVSTNATVTKILKNTTATKVPTNATVTKVATNTKVPTNAMATKVSPNTTTNKFPTNATMSKIPTNTTINKVPINGTHPETHSLTPTPDSSHALKIKDRTIAVVKKTRRIYSGAQTVDCWFVKNNAAKLIDGRYEDYVVTHLFDTGDGPNGTNSHQN